MRWHCSVESTENGELSALAILETVLAVTGAFYIAIEYGFFSHLITYAFLAPLFLLRTQKSSKLSIIRFYKFNENCIKYLMNPVWIGLLRERLRVSNLFVKIVLLVLLVPITIIPVIPLVYLVVVFSGLFFIKVYTLLETLFRHPFESIGSLPTNWYKYAFCVDITHPPEAIPGAETLCPQLDEEYGITYYCGLMSSLIFQHAVHGTVGMPMNGPIKKPKYLSTKETVEFPDIDSRTARIGSVMTMLSYIPSVLYRSALKSVLIMYMPFIWLVRREPSDSSLKTKLSIYVCSQIEKTKRFYSWFVLLFLTVIPIYGVFATNNIHVGDEFRIILGYFVPVEQISSWNVTRALSALVTLILFFYSDKVFLRLSNGDCIDGRPIELIIGLLGKLRLLFTIWTLACGAFLLYSHTSWSTLPSMNWLPT